MKIPLPSPNTKHNISLIIPTRDQCSLLKKCINGLLENTDYPLTSLEIIIVNNKSSDEETLRYLSELSSINIIKIIDYDARFNFSIINNLGVKHAKYDLVCLLNNDVEVISPNWLSEMSYFMEREDIGCVGAKLYYPDDTIQHAGVVLGINGVAGHIYKHCPRNSSGYRNQLFNTRYCSAVTAACMLVKKSLYIEAGGFDERLAVAYNDVDFCLTLNTLGYKHIWTPKAELYHHESKSRGTHKHRTKSQQRIFKKEVTYMKKKWGNQLSTDRFWSEDWPLIETWCGDLPYE